jgi:catechol 2,3-dioxygenase-like lactoylglutathione lyase family enzyme
MLANEKIVAFVGVRQAGRARAFYRDTLGLQLVSEDNFALVFDVNGTILRVSLVPELTPAKFTVLGWHVKDAAATARELQKAGVALERFPGMDQDELGIWTAPGGARVAWFKDPDGNILSITEFDHA